jgi:hypothetical protein
VFLIFDTFYVLHGKECVEVSEILDCGEWWCLAWKKNREMEGKFTDSSFVLV